MTKAGSPDPPQAQSLTEGLWALASRPLTAPDRARAALHLVDWLGCAIAGAATPTGQAMQQVAAGHVFALTGAAGALAMGGFGSLLEMDDVHRTALLHPGPVILPVVMALAAQADSDRALGAICGGYDAMVRLGASVGPGHYAMFHNTATCGGIGAAVAAALMLGLTGDQAVWAMGHALSLAGGVWQCRNEPGATKHLHVAEAARRGVQAALYARAGLAGPRRILEGPQGFFAALARDGTPETVLDGPADWRLYQVSFKPWPACRHAHPAIDAALMLVPRLAGGGVTHIRIDTFADALLFCDRPAPVTEAEAKFSLQHAVAVTLAKGAPDLSDFAGAALNDPAIAALRRVIQVAATPGFTGAYPAHFGATVSVETTQGATHSATVTDAWGDTENPMDPAAVLAKYDRLTHWAGIDPAMARAIRQAALALATGGALADLSGALARLPDPVP